MDREKKYHEMRAQVRALGLYRRLYGYYAIYGFVVTFGIFFSLYLIALTDNLLFQLLNAIFFGVLIVQAGMLGHDLSHNQVFEYKDKNLFFAMLTWGLFCGFSESDWYFIHNTHHEHPNQLEADPDMDIPFFFEEKQVPAKQGFFLKKLLPYQHILFFATLPVLYVTKLFATWQRTLENRSLRNIPEVIFALIHFGILFYATFAFLPLSTALAFLVVHATFVGLYMSFVFAPNHKGEEILAADHEITWLNQITSTRNLYPSFLVFYLFGGLNFQIEHHLFPNMARPNYWKVQPIIKRFCVESGISYHETTLWGSMREIYEALRRVATAYRTKTT